MRIPVRRKCKDFMVKRIPILGWLPLYTWNTLFQDAFAGLTVGLTAVPQGIAYAIVAGLPAQYGLYSGFMGCFVYLIFGGAKDITVGPTAIMALLIQPYVINLGEDFAVLLCFITGCLITLMGFLHIGFLVDFISMPVICGFTNAAALIIAASQLHTLLGIQRRTESFIDSIEKVIENTSQIQLYDTILGVSCIIILIGLKNLPGSRRGNLGKKIMWLLSLGRNAVVVILGITLVYIFACYDVRPFAITGNIAEGLPPFQPPPFSTILDNKTYNFVEMLSELQGSLVSIPLIAILESIAIAKAFAKGRSLDANQEMLALGLCNVLGSFVRSMPVTGSFTRTAVNYASGVQTPMGGIITGAIVLLACGLLTSIFQLIPKSTLAAVIIAAMYYMLEFKTFIVLWRTKKIDLFSLTVTLIACLAISLEYGMIIGIFVNLLLLLYSTARPGLSISERNVDNVTIVFVSPQQSLSYPAAEYIRERIMDWCNEKSVTFPVIVDGTHVHRIDATVAKNLQLLQIDLEMKNQKLIFWNWCANAKNTLISYDKTLTRYFRESNNLSELFSGYKFEFKRCVGLPYSSLGANGLPYSIVEREDNVNLNLKVKSQ